MTVLLIIKYIGNVLGGNSIENTLVETKEIVDRSAVSSTLALDSVGVT